MYLFEFTQWIVKNEENIFNFIHTMRSFIDSTIPLKDIEMIKQVVFDDSITIQNFEQIYHIMKPLKILSDSLESNSCILGYVIPK